MRRHKHSRPRGYEDEPDIDLDPTIGSFVSFTEVPKLDRKLPAKRQIGFIRQKEKAPTKKK